MRSLFLGLALGVLFAGCTDTPPGGGPSPTPVSTPTPSPTPPLCVPVPTPMATATPVPVPCDSSNEQCSTYTCSVEGSPEMLPGSNCQNCHSPGNMPPDQRMASPVGALVPTDNLNWTIAGTAFADILGSRSLVGATVRVTDANDKVVTLTTNRAGNFYSNTTVTPPLRARITAGDTTFEMASPVNTGACGSCHSCDGPAGGKLYGGEQPTPAPTPTPVPGCETPTPLPPTFTSVNANILQPSCAFSNCHGNGSSAGGLSLESSTAYANLVNVSSQQLKSMLLVKPGDPASSYFWHKIKGDQASVGGSGSTMPIGGSLNAAQLQSVDQWISDGALNN